jgi:group II intron reverse transcriptase/maturase
MSLRSYAKWYKNQGAMTPGSTEETVDGMSMAKIAKIIEAIRQEKWPWTPGRRVLKDKPKGGKRPLGMPIWSDKVGQDIVRSLLEAYYEPQCSPHSHGCRPTRGCPTALTEIHHIWVGTKWFMEGDIKGCFDTIDHTILLHILQENTHDNRFLRLIEGALKAGYCEEWTSHPSRSGSPQGGIVSPILSHIDMDRVDKCVEATLIPEYTRGEKRAGNPAYKWQANQAASSRGNGNRERAETIRRELQQLPSGNPHDPGYRRLRYIRYADDVLLGFIGPLTEAEEIKERITTFLRTALTRTWSAAKTLMTHAHSGKARFLGYEIGMMHRPDKFDNPRRRVGKGKVGLSIPEDVMHPKRKRYLRDEKPIQRPARLNDSEYDIMARYQGAYRGLVHYYGWAQNRAHLDYVRWTMATSLLKTLAGKNHTSVMQEAKRLQGTLQTPEGPRTCLQLTIPREGKRPLVATFGGLSLKRVKHPVIKDQVITPYPRMRSEIIERLVHDTCDVCGSKESREMPHRHKLADLNKEGSREKPRWMKIMISRKRKSIPLCRRCHDDIHSNRLTSKRQGNRRAG